MAELTQTHESCCKIPTANSCPCPVCGDTGRKVTALTLDHHLPRHLRGKFGEEATFCLNPDCDVVYCNPKGFIARKGETNFSVTIKEPGDEVYVCYCFEHKRGNLRKELHEKGKTDIPDQIREKVKQGLCDCARKNPQGACCLGNVVSSIKKIKDDLGIP